VVPVSYLGLQTGYPYWNVSLFLSVPSVKYRNINFYWVTTCSFHILSNSLFTVQFTAAPAGCRCLSKTTRLVESDCTAGSALCCEGTRRVLCAHHALYTMSFVARADSSRVVQKTLCILLNNAMLWVP
jgi:hypothetical protein